MDVCVVILIYAMSYSAKPRIFSTLCTLFKLNYCNFESEMGCCYIAEANQFDCTRTPIIIENNKKRTQSTK